MFRYICIHFELWIQRLYKTLDFIISNLSLILAARIEQFKIWFYLLIFLGWTKHFSTVNLFSFLRFSTLPWDNVVLFWNSHKTKKIMIPLNQITNSRLNFQVKSKIIWISLFRYVDFLVSTRERIVSIQFRVLFLNLQKYIF